MTPPTTTAEVMTGYGIDPPPVDFPEVAHPAPLGGDTAEVVFVLGEAADDALAAVQQSYAKDVTDEFVLPTVIGG